MTTDRYFDVIPRFGMIEYNTLFMAKNTSILLGNYFNNFIDNQVKSGKYTSASEVIRAALRLFEHEESKKSELIKALKKGEQSGFVTDFKRADFLKNMHEKHASAK